MVVAVGTVRPCGLRATPRRHAAHARVDRATGPPEKRRPPRVRVIYRSTTKEYSYITTGTRAYASSSVSSKHGPTATDAQGYYPFNYTP